MKPILFSLALLLSSFPAFAQCSIGAFVIDPPHAYQGEQVDVRMTGGCPSGAFPPEPVVTFNGNTITIDVTHDPSGPQAVFDWGERVRLGTLPPAAYTIIVRMNGVESRRGSVTVEPRPFRIAPVSGPAGTRVMITGAPARSCETDDPCTYQVFFDGIAAPAVAAGRWGELVVMAPAHAAGPVDVTLMATGRPSLTIPNGFRYTAETDLTNFTRVLFPLTYAGGGAHGSQWDSEIVVRNESPVAVETVPDLTNFPGLPITSGIEAYQSVRFPPEPRDGGSFLYFPRGMEKHFAFASHVVDRSRVAHTLGAEMPVVRAEDTAEELFIPNVPLDATRYRVMLRVYDFDGQPSRVDVFANANPELPGPTVGGPLAAGSQFVPGFRAFDLTANPRWPKSGTVDLHIVGRRGERLWAVVSVTNNETQQVTLYTPQN